MPLVALVAASLWAAAVSEIGLGLRKGSFSRALSAVMAAAVSAVAVFVVVAAGALFPYDVADGEMRAPGCEAARGAFVFGFGLERASQVGEGCDRGGTGS